MARCGGGTGPRNQARSSSPGAHGRRYFCRRVRDSPSSAVNAAATPWGPPPSPPGPPGDPIHSPSLAPGSIHHPPFGSKIEWAPSIRPHRFRAATPGLHPSINGSGVCRWLVGHDGCAWWQIIITFDLYIDAPRPYSRLHLRCEWIDLASSSLAPSFLLSFVHSSSQLSLLPCLDRSCLYAGNPCPA